MRKPIQMFLLDNGFVVSNQVLKMVTPLSDTNSRHPKDLALLPYYFALPCCITSRKLGHDIIVVCTILGA
jgi:hypothetical protein